MTVDPSRPTIDDFWATIEAAWSSVPGGLESRERFLSATSADDRLTAAEALDTQAMIEALRTTLRAYTSPQLARWDAHCERALYDIDREDVHEVLDGSDDGFLYARGFVVAVGREYFDKINADPTAYGVDVLDAEEESMCYVACHVHNEVFGDWPPQTGISRETCSNKAGWP